MKLIILYFDEFWHVYLVYKNSYATYFIKIVYEFITYQIYPIHFIKIDQIFREFYI